MAGLAASPPTQAYKKPFFTQRRREATYGYLFALPFIVGFLCLTAGPMVFSLYASFTEYGIVTAPKWIGLENYNEIFRFDDLFRLSLRNTIFYVLIKTPLAISLALGLAMLLNMDIPFKAFFRTVFYLPTVLTGVAAVFLWVWVLNPTGLLNRGLALVGIGGPNWFYDPNWSKPGLIVMAMWYVGGPMLIFLAGLNGIPVQLYEAAEIDGAGALRRFWNITIPMLSPTIFFLVVTNIIGAFQVFTSAYVVSTTAGTAAGDPARSLLFYEVYLYETAFKKLEMGYASALAWILFAIVMAVTGVQLWLAKKWVHYET